jgi:hypothetical protein
MGDMTTHTPAQLIRDFIQATAPVGTFTGWVFNIGKLPAAPDKVITLIDQGGPAAFPHMLADWPGLQILVRSSIGGDGYQTSWLMVRKVRDLILGMPSQPVQFPELTSLTERGHIIPMGYDDKDRHVWSSNYQLIVEPAPNAITHRVSL